METITIEDSFPKFTPLEELESQQPVSTEEPKVEPVVQTTDDPDASTVVIDPSPKFTELNENGEETEDPNYVTDEEVVTDDTPAEEEVDDMSADELKEYMETVIDLGLIMKPDDFEFDGTEEKLEELINYHKEQSQTLAEQELLKKVGDPVLRDLIEFGVNNGQFTDMQQLLQRSGQSVALDSLDFADPKVAENFVTNFHKQSTNLSDEKVKLLVEDDKDRIGLEQAANDYAEQIKQANSQAEAEQRQAAETQRVAYENYQADYRKNFMTALGDTGYTQGKQQEILDNFKNVKLQNGQQMANYQYKTELIQSKPDHFIQFLDILAGYDPENGFKIPETKQDKVTKETNTVLSKLRKGVSRSSGRAPKPSKRAVPARNPVDRNITQM